MFWASAAITLPAAFVALVLARSYGRVRGTTLVAPLVWAAIALAAVYATALIEVLSGTATPPGWLAAARYTAATTTFCPLMAVLGAKRPQDRAWQFIVLALVGILALPALEDLLYRYAQPVAPHAAWRWFIAVLIVIETANYLATGYGAAVALYAAAQIVLAADYLPWGPQIPSQQRAATALGLAAVACGLAAAGGALRRPPAEPLATLRRDFRDWFGMLWALRVEQRAAVASRDPTTNEAPAKNDAHTKREHGAAARSQEMPDNAREYVSLLRRFVSREWIESRLHGEKTERASRNDDGESSREEAGN